jgi:tagatose 6-phosphate kinase
VVTDDGDATVLNEPGPVLTDAEWAAYRVDFASLVRDADVVTISGSMPRGVPDDAYGQLVEIARSAGTPAILDCDGPALRDALPAGPAVVKINEHEAGACTGIEIGSLDGVFAAAEQLHTLGACDVVITRGAAGVAARTELGRRFVGGNAGTVSGNPTGAGDAFTAGLAASMTAGLDWPDRLRRASAWAAAAVARPTAGELDPTIAADHETHTTIQEMS